MTQRLRRFNKVDVNYKNWKTAVFKRDRYQCQWPGCTCKKKLQAHHIRRWADCILTRYQVSNGITLCKSHHFMIRNKEEQYILLFTQTVVKNEQANNIKR